jgi:hypothetical protein
LLTSNFVAALKAMNMPNIYDCELSFPHPAPPLHPQSPILQSKPCRQWQFPIICSINTKSIFALCAFNILSPRVALFLS